MCGQTLARVPHTKTAKFDHISTSENISFVECSNRPLCINISARIVGDFFIGLPCFATSAYRQPLPRFPLTCSAKVNGRCTNGSQRTNVVHACWCSAHSRCAMRDILNNICHKRIRRSMMSSVKGGIESHGGHIEH
jgi:hypothetical protein